jgi:hypothetical protein
MTLRGGLTKTHQTAHNPHAIAVAWVQCPVVGPLGGIWRRYRDWYLRWEERYPPSPALYTAIAALFCFAAGLDVVWDANVLTTIGLFVVAVLWTGKAVRIWWRRPRSPRVAR